MKNFKKAFTFFEMLIVIIIIGILMLTLLPRISNAQKKARDTAKQTDLKEISSKLIMYNAEYKKYPTGHCARELYSKLKDYNIEEDYFINNKLVNKTYGTKKGGCKGSYGYTRIISGDKLDSFVLVAHMELIKNDNFVLSGDYINQPNFTEKTHKKDIHICNKIKETINKSGKCIVNKKETNRAIYIYIK